MDYNVLVGGSIAWTVQSVGAVPDNNLWDIVWLGDMRVVDSGGSGGWSLTAVGYTVQGTYNGVVVVKVPFDALDFIGPEADVGFFRINVNFKPMFGLNMKGYSDIAVGRILPPEPPEKPPVGPPPQSPPPTPMDCLCRNSQS